MDEKQGIEAIIYLQSLAGITETEEQARAGWRSMSDSEKQTTMFTYNLLGDMGKVDWTKEPEDR